MKWLYIVIVLLLYPTSTLAAPSFPTITFPNDIVTFQEIVVDVVVDGLSDEPYHVKVRAGSDFNDAQTCKTNTQNCSEWLNDNDNWSDQPTITPENGNWSGGVIARIKDSAPLGQNNLKISVKKVSGGDPIPSGETPFNLQAAPTATPTTTPLPTLTPTPSPANTPTSVPSPTSTKSPTPTKTPTPNPTSLPAPSSTPKPTVTRTPTLVPTPTDESDPTPQVLAATDIPTTTRVIPTPRDDTRVKKSFPYLGFILVGIGLAGLAVSAKLIMHARG